MMDKRLMTRLMVWMVVYHKHRSCLIHSDPSANFTCLLFANCLGHHMMALLSTCCRYMCNVWYKNSGDKELQTVICIVDILDVLLTAAVYNYVVHIFVNSYSQLVVSVRY